MNRIMSWLDKPVKRLRVSRFTLILLFGLLGVWFFFSISMASLVFDLSQTLTDGTLIAGWVLLAMLFPWTIVNAVVWVIKWNRPTVSGEDQREPCSSHNPEKLNSEEDINDG